MCGIAGVFNLRTNSLPAFNPRAVLSSIRHRGPDDDGVYREGGVFLGVTRLAIIDPVCGKQPVSDESGRFHLVMNGEIFDYGVLMEELKGRGHQFRSRCDTEVAVHLFEELWDGALARIDGQFALAVYDARERRLLLARDRMGISPLFYAVAGDHLVFASEMKAIFATGLVRPELDVRSLDAVAAFGSVPAPRAMFRGIRALQPGHLLEVRNGTISGRTFWDLDFNEAGQYPKKSVAEWSDEFRERLLGACRRRLRADVPVGLYLSGGIDSSAVAALCLDSTETPKEVFSIGFPEPGFDESRQAQQMADFLGYRMHLLTYRQQDLARDLPKMTYQGETPLMSTEGVPLMALSRLAAQHVKVVLTGEGADEALGGYEYFRWEALRQRLGEGGWAVARLLLWPYVRRVLGPRNPVLPQAADAAYVHELFGYNPAIMLKFFYFRMVREMVYSAEMLERQRGLSDAEFLDLPMDRMRRWDVVNRTLYLASRVLMSNHLLGSRGDRALMTHSVEGRYPYLDREVQEFLATVPPLVKTRFTCQKLLLRRAMAGRLPPDVVWRKKKMFLAPFGTPFVGADATDRIREVLRPETIAEFGYFDPAKVERIAALVAAEKESLARDQAESIRPDRRVVERTVLGMAMNFVVSTQVLADQVRRGEFDVAARPPAEPAAARI